MKNQTETLLVLLVLIVVGAIAWAVLSSSQVEMAAATANATIAGGQLPMAAVISGELTGWALKTLVGVVALALAGGLVAWVRQWWKKTAGSRDPRRTWRSGPNAQWQGQERGPRAVSDAELMRMLMMQQMMAGRPDSRRQPPVSGSVDDQLPIEW